MTKQRGVVQALSLLFAVGDACFLLWGDDLFFLFFEVTAEDFRDPVSGMMRFVALTSTPRSIKAQAANSAKKIYY